MYLYLPTYFLFIVTAYGRLFWLYSKSGDFHLLHSQEGHRLGRGKFLVLLWKIYSSWRDEKKICSVSWHIGSLYFSVLLLRAGSHVFSIIDSCILNGIFCYKISTQSYPSIYGEKKIIKVILELLYLALNKKRWQWKRYNRQQTIQGERILRARKSKEESEKWHLFTWKLKWDGD